LARAEQRKKRPKTIAATEETVPAATANVSPEEEEAPLARAEIASTLIHGIEGVPNLASLKPRPKDRSWYSSPLKASHLNFKQARTAMENTEDQFYKMSNAINPKHQPEDENWAYVNSMVVTTDQTTTPPRNGFGNKNRNLITGDVDAVNTKVRVLVAHGGREGAKKMFEQLLRSGMFEDEIDRYVEQRDRSIFGESLTFNPSCELVTSNDELHDIRKKKTENRQRAEKQRSAEEVDNDADIGAYVAESDDFA